MNARRLLVCCLPLLFLLARCSDDGGSSGGFLTIQSLPSSVGTAWTYQRLAIAENIRVLHPGGLPPFDTVESVIQVTVADLVTFNDPGAPPIPASEFITQETQLRPSPGSSTEYEYYGVTDSGWYLHGYSGWGAVAPPLKRSPSAVLRFAGKDFGSMQELLREYGIFCARVTADSTMRLIPPLLEFPLPLSYPREWVYRTAGSLFFIGKRAERDTMISLGGKRSPCVVVRWWYDLNGDSLPDDDIDIIDYISSIGFLRRVVVVRDIQVISSSGPEPVAIIDFRDTFTLTAITTP